jgi:hypothetical protein
MILVAEVSAGQLVAARAWTRRGGADADIAVSQLLTGIAVTAILVPGLGALPNAAWATVFAVMTAWFAWRLWRASRGRTAAVASGHYAPHLARSAAMLYLFAAIAGPSAEGSGMSTSGPGGMAGLPPDGASGGMPAIHAPTLALIFALVLIAFTVHDLDRGSASGAGPVVTVPPGQPAQANVAAPAPRASLAALTAERLLLSPAMVKGCRVATGVTLAVTLIIMI